MYQRRMIGTFLAILVSLGASFAGISPELPVVTLFDGKTLQGWTTEGGPYDGKALWTVEDGAITGREGPGRAGGLIYTERYYSDFVFSCDVWMTFPFDSGIFLRMAPRDLGKGIQVTLDHREPTGQIGGLYSEGFLHDNETAKKKYRRGEWNHFKVRVTGRKPRVQVWMNGEPITDYRLPKEKEGYTTAGMIGLQVHGNRDDPPGSKVQFKNIQIQELPNHDDRLFTMDHKGVLSATPKGKSLGWRALFNGQDLSGWEPLGDKDGYAVRNGLMVFPVKGSDAYIRTKEDFRDFKLRLDFKTGIMANSGVFLRGSREEGAPPPYSGCEIQILDDFNWERITGDKVKDWQVSGSLYASLPPGVSALRPIGDWNTYQITYKGSRMKVELNGRTLYDIDTFEVPVVYPDKPKFKDRVPTGFIGLQRHAPSQVEGDAYAWFRNIFIRELGND